MTDAEFTLFQKVTAIVLTLLNAGCLAALFYPFISEYGLHRNRRMIKCAWVYAVYTAISIFGIIFPGFGVFGMIAVIFILGLLAPALQIDKYFALFLTCVYFCFDRSIGLMSNSILYLLNTKFACCEKLEIALRNTAYNYASAYAFEVILLVLLVYLISHKILIAPLYLNFREWSCLCMIPLIGIVFGEIVDRLLFVVKDRVAFGIYDEYPAFLAVIPLIAILFCIGIFLTVISYQEMVKLQEEKEKYFVQEQQVRAMQERIREVEQFYTGIRKMRHEMRNHLTNIKGLVRNENYTAIEKYISEMDESMSLFDVSIKTGNPVLDVIVNDKKKSAESSGIRFESDFCFPASDCFHAYDIGIIVNNLLVNAMEACEKMKGEDKYICLSGRQKKKFYMIEVTNSCEGTAQFDQSSGLPISTKQKSSYLHGIGLSNVKEQALKYMGDIDIKATVSDFSVTVLLQEIRREA